jgi:uncharacterized protein (TIGR02246 family)
MHETTDRQISSVIERAINACLHKNAVAFASLFAEDAELILISGHRLVGKRAIEQATADYFNQIQDIKIELKKITIEDNRASIRWIWQDTRQSDGHRRKAENSIEIHFQAGSIELWRES